MSESVTPAMWEAYWKMVGVQNDGRLTNQQIKELVSRFKIKNARARIKFMNTRARTKREGHMQRNREVATGMPRSAKTGRFVARKIVPKEVSEVCSRRDQDTLCTFMLAMSKLARNDVAFGSALDDADPPPPLRSPRWHNQVCRL
jgi:hypothetical protein